jgi:hypothetical protein
MKRFLLLLLVSLMLSACSLFTETNANRFVGTWQVEMFEVLYYDFNADMSFRIYNEANETQNSGEYSYNDDVVVFSHDDGTEDSAYYAFNDNGTLTITPVGGGFSFTLTPVE